MDAIEHIGENPIQTRGYLRFLVSGAAFSENCAASPNCLWCFPRRSNLNSSPREKRLKRLLGTVGEAHAGPGPRRANSSCFITIRKGTALSGSYQNKKLAEWRVEFRSAPRLLFGSATSSATAFISLASVKRLLQTKLRGAFETYASVMPKPNTRAKQTHFPKPFSFQPPQKFGR